MLSQSSFPRSREIRLSSLGRRERLPLALLRIMRLRASTSSELTTGLDRSGCTLRESSLLENSPAIGVHKARLHVPPFVPHRVVGQRVFVGPDYEETVAAAPLHIECPSKQALSRRITDIDKDAAFLWFSGESEAQKRGSVMVYLPVTFDPTASRRVKLGRSGAFYVGFSQREVRLGAGDAAWSLSYRSGAS